MVRRFLLIIPLALTGCVSFDARDARREQTELFRKELGEKASVWLAEPVSLEDCVRIAMTNNYEVRAAELDREVGRWAKTMAFSSFLPQVEAKASYVWYQDEPVVSPKSFESASADAGLPVFMPAAWFLYDAARHGADAADLAASYVRQSIVLKTTQAYYDVIVQQETIAALKTQLEAAEERSGRVAGLAREGMARGWELGQATYLAEARRTELAAAKRKLATLKGDLLRCLGLSPLSDIELLGDDQVPARPEGSVEDLVLRALEIHPELSLADRQVVIKETEVRKAFCDFIPVLNLFISYSHSGNTLMGQPADNLSFGFSGAWSVFKGFANTAAYNTKKVERRKSELAREETFLSVMARVIAAEAAVRDAADGAAVAATAYETALGKAEDFEARAKEGLVPLNEALDARAAADLAQVELVRSRYRERVAVAALRFTMGE